MVFGYSFSPTDPDPTSNGLLIAAGLLLAALTVTVAWLTRLGRPGRPFVVFGTLATTIYLTQGIAGLSGQHAYANQVTPYFAIAIPFAALHLGLRFAASHTRLRYPVAVQVGVLVSAAGLLTVYAMDHGAYGTLDSGRGWLNLTSTTMAVATFAGLVAVLWHHGRTRHDPGLLIMAAAFAPYSVFYPLHNLIPGLMPGIPGAWKLVMLGLSLPVFLPLFSSTHYKGLRAALVVPTASVAVLAVLNGVGATQLAFDLMLYFMSLWALFVPIVTAYALLRFHVLGVELGMKTTLWRSLVAGAVATAFFVASEAAEAVLPIEGFWLGIAAAAVVTVAIRPVAGTAKQLVDKWLPGIQETPAYLEDRRSFIYRHALQAAVHDGAVTRSERAALHALAAELGLAEATRRELDAASGLQPKPADHR